jgi:hypothetical protein
MVKVAFRGEHFQYVHKHVDTAMNANEPLISWNREMFGASVQDSHVLWVYTVVSSALHLSETSLTSKALIERLI